jgi:hypothetical protein
MPYSDEKKISIRLLSSLLFSTPSELINEPITKVMVAFLKESGLDVSTVGLYSIDK